MVSIQMEGERYGKYDIGTKGAWYTDERAKKFVIPSEPVGASIIGFIVRKEDEQKYKTIDDFAKNKRKLIPISFADDGRDRERIRR